MGVAPACRADTQDAGMDIRDIRDENIGRAAEKWRKFLNVHAHPVKYTRSHSKLRLILASGYETSRST